MKTFFLIFYCLLISIFCWGQENMLTKYSFLVLERNNDYKLVKYTNQDTSYVKKVLFKDKADTHAFFSYVIKFVKNNRYLINELGDVFDLIENKILHRQLLYDTFLGVRGDSVLFSWNNCSKEYYPNSPKHDQIKTPSYFFNLKTKQIEEIYSITKDFMKGNHLNILCTHKYKSNYVIGLSGILSPNEQKIAYFVPHFSEPTHHCINMYRIKGDIFVKSSNQDSIKILSDAVFFFSTYRAMFSPFPVKWLSNNELLVQKNIGNIAKIRLDTLQVIDYKPLDYVKDCHLPSSFLELSDTEVIYHCETAKGEYFRVDLENNTIDLTTQLNLSSNYSAEAVIGTQISKLYYKEEEILNTTSIENPYTIITNYYINEDDMLLINTGHTISIYNPATKQWKHIDNPDLIKVAGWLNEK
jgi:hypothetical protein